MSRLQAFVDEIQHLKPIPAVANQLLAVVDKPGSTMEDIANVIQYDPMITMSVLKVCNSAYFGLKHPVESIKDAVNMLGTAKVIELALLKSGVQSLSGPQKGYGLEKGDMWQFSVSSAIVAKQVAQRLSLDNKNTIFTAALLKDIGKVLLGKHIEKAADKVAVLVEQEGFSFQEAEKKIFGIDHAELGAMIAKMWKLSPRMVKIIRYHHLTDEKMSRDSEVAAVYLADCICMMMGSGVGSDGLSYRFKEEVMTHLNVTAQDVSLIMAEFIVNMQEIETFLKVA